MKELNNQGNEYINPEGSEEDLIMDDVDGEDEEEDSCIVQSSDLDAPKRESHTLVDSVKENLDNMPSSHSLKRKITKKKVICLNI